MKTLTEINLLPLILLFFTTCSKKMEEQKFKSEYNYSINIPENWAEYETDEKNTNAFFDTTKWTGNLRITPMNYIIENPTKFLLEKQNKITSESFQWQNSKGVFFVEKPEDEQIYYWFLIESNKLYICSFTVGDLDEKNEIKKEILKVEKILKTLKSQ